MHEAEQTWQEKLQRTAGEKKKIPRTPHLRCVFDCLLLYKNKITNSPHAPRARNAQKRCDSWKQALLVPGLARAYLFVLEKHNNNHHILALLLFFFKEISPSSDSLKL